MRLLCRSAASAVVVIACCASLAHAETRGSFAPCSTAVLQVATKPPGAFLPVSHLGIRHTTCARARLALRHGVFALTPGGPRFSTPGFLCSSPVLPVRYAGPPYFVCRHGQQAFRFLRLE